MDGGWGALTKGGRGVRKEEEEERKNWERRANLSSGTINKQRETKSEGIPGPCGWCLIGSIPSESVIVRVW